MNKKMRRKFQATMDIIDGIVNDTIDIPNNALILDVDDLIDIFTKKRMELVEFINKYKPNSVQELANLTHRKKQAVDRDLKILEQHEILTMERKGRKVVPKVEKKILIMGLGGITSII